MPDYMKIDLAKWRGTKDNRVLTGRDLGGAARREAGLDALDEKNQIVEVNVPSDFLTVSSSFFRGMFGDSVRKLGDEGFRSHYHFVGKNIDRVKDDGIRDALREAFPLGRQKS